MEKLKRRTFEILCEPEDDDRLATVISLFIIVLIAVNVLVGILETEPSLGLAYPRFFYIFEFVSVIIFTIEYVGRIWSCTLSEEHSHPFYGRLKMAMTPMAVIDFLAIAPFFLQFIFTGLDLRFVRALRLFRLFRIFKLGRYTESMTLMVNVIRRRFEELVMSIIIVFVMIVLNASIMWLFEHEAQPGPFRSVMSAMWWAVITVTTIGYGDVFPITIGGKIVGGIIGFLGICIFALPVGIIGSAFVEEIDERKQRELARKGILPSHQDQPKASSIGVLGSSHRSSAPPASIAALPAVAPPSQDAALREEVDYLRNEVSYLEDELRFARQKLAEHDLAPPPSPGADG